MIITPTPAFNSKLTDIIVELQQLRNHGVSGSTEPWVFYELKNLFHIVEALASARIEGNHTTLATFVERRIDKKDTENEKLIEISNLINALEFIDDNISASKIDAQFMYCLHKIVVSNLSPNKEGDTRPGAYRTEPRSIANSSHLLPQPSDVKDLMDELYDYINEPCDPKVDLLKIAVAHHRFVWIHPFGNGNGRTVRLLTYSMLCKKGFITPGSARLFNPTAVFAGNREKYYDKLSIADKGDEDSLSEWCLYVLEGLQDEIKKSQKLAERDFVRDQLLLPTFAWANEKGITNEIETKILNRLARKQIIKAGDIRGLWPEGYSHVVISKRLAKMREQNFIRTLKPNGREYILQLTGNKLTRGILDCMEAEGMLPVKVDDLAEKS